MEGREVDNSEFEKNRRKWLAIIVTVLVSWVLCVLCIYGFAQYGLALFVFLPFFMGAASAILYGLKGEITKGDAEKVGFISLAFFTAGLGIFAIEGMICIIMVAPIGAFFTWIGSLVGYGIISKSPGKATTTLLVLIGIIPVMGLVEKDHEPTVTSVVTSMEINADAETVWKNVIEFPELKEPTELIFNAGIAYPIDARIEGTGVGAIRHCNFTTGSFVEPITIWDEPRLLKFDVEEQPAPLKELSFWDVDAPHLHNYFVSKQGQFKLTVLPNGNTLLEGTTWYYHNIRPEFYWHIWSDYMVHKIHERVLKHIKENSEREK